MTIIEKLDGTRFRLPSVLGVKTAELKVNPIDINFDSQNIKNAPGRNRTTRYHGVRKLQIKMLLQAYDIMSTIEIRDELARIFDLEEDFYIYESLPIKSYGFQTPGETAFTTATDHIEYKELPNKRWLVERTNNDGIEWKGFSGKRTIELETSQLPYGETPYTSQEIASKTWSEGKWAYGMGVTWSGPPPVYTFTANTFSVMNFSDIVIDPTRRIPLKIELRGTFASQVTITNITTGDTFIYNGALGSGDVLVLEGISKVKNGITIVGNSNKKSIRLAKGENQFVVSGGIVTSCKFDFRFYYV